MTNVCFDCLSSNLSGVNAVAESVYSVSGNQNQSFLSLLAEIRTDFVAMRHLIDRAMEDKAGESENAAKANVPGELLALIREEVIRMGAMEKTLRNNAKGRPLAGLYGGLFVFPVIRSVIDRMGDIAGAIESLMGEDGDFVSAEELLRRLG